MNSEREIEAIVKRIGEGYQPLKVILFGSHAWGQPTEDSDIDLLIVKETSDRFIDRWVAVRDLIADPARRIPVEPIVLTPQELDRRIERGDQFFQRIVTHGKLLYAA
ncbi:MAG: nucleotidyltransferase domain-containing protein [candidate division NC10 bacterium]|nr:nucleotidyltransferase domain-containing protein [candidate division NC10 bacterium]MBI3086088.1 nucleotidyltransferase domain-containing protein [candidate division NC10 bacterium]